MGTFAVGPLMTTKPYVSGASYIARMSDYCGICAFDPKGTCPFSSLYWAFLARHGKALAGNPRLRLAMASLRKREKNRQRRDQEVFLKVRDTLSAGGHIAPGDLG